MPLGEFQKDLHVGEGLSVTSVCKHRQHAPPNDAFARGFGVIIWLRSKIHFKKVVVATAFVLALQLIISLAIAASMQAAGFLLDEARQLCSTEDTDADSAAQSHSSHHKAFCDECAFSAESGTVPNAGPINDFGFLLPLPLLPVASVSFDQPNRREPRSSQGPPLGL
jgi:hypothetical protein